MPRAFILLIGICIFSGVSVSAFDYTTDSLAVRVILDSNGLTSISVGSVSDSMQGRIVKLRLNSKSLHVVPTVIGNLSSLDSINFSRNNLTNLPLSIVSLNCDIDVSYNHLCNILDTVRHWLDKHALFCPNSDYLCWYWVGGQICSSTVILNDHIKETIAPPRFTCKIINGVLQFSCASVPSFKMVVNFYTLSGKFIHKASGEGNILIPLSKIPQSLFAIELIINGKPSFFLVSTKR